MKLTVDLGESHFGRARGTITKWFSSPQVSSKKWISSSIHPVTAIGQFCAKAVLSKNLEAVSRIVTDAARAGAKMVFLPEASDFITRADEVLSLTKPLAQNEFVQGLRAKAEEAGVWVSVGVHETVRAFHPASTPKSPHSCSYPLTGHTYSPIGILCLKSSDPKRVFNSHLIINSSGDIVSNYHKIHLFVRHVRPKLSCRECLGLHDPQDVDIPGTRIMESDTTVPGDKIHDPVETPAGKGESTQFFSVAGTKY